MDNVTTYDEILDLALISIKDYRLNNLYVEDIVDFTIMMEGFMFRGLPNFDNCVQDLTDRTATIIDESGETSVITSGYFNFVMTDLEKSIIADYTVIAWFDKEINDITRIAGMLQNKNEAHRYSEANLLTAKRNRRIDMIEDVNQKKTNYGLLNTSFSSWADGDYGI